VRSVCVVMTASGAVGATSVERMPTHLPGGSSAGALSAHSKCTVHVHCRRCGVTRSLCWQDPASAQCMIFNISQTHTLPYVRKITPARPDTPCNLLHCYFDDIRTHRLSSPASRGSPPLLISSSAFLLLATHVSQHSSIAAST
jgi:hypothetical protein